MPIQNKSSGSFRSAAEIEVHGKYCSNGNLLLCLSSFNLWMIVDAIVSLLNFVIFSE